MKYHTKDTIDQDDDEDQCDNNTQAKAQMDPTTNLLAPGRCENTCKC